MLNIIFMGSPDFAVPSLVALHKSEHRISAVVTNVDKRRGRGTQESPTPVKAKALELGLPVIEADDLKTKDFEEKLRGLNADLIIVVAFRILPPNILEIPKIGSINLHASLLPKYRGAAPIHWAIIKGEKTTGCTVFFLDERVDTGNIISQRSVEIGADDTTGDIYQKMMYSGAEQLLDAVNLIDEGGYELQPQNDAEAGAAPKLNKENTQIDFTMEAIQVHDFIRGLSPVPTAWTMWDKVKIKIFRARVGDEVSGLPGELVVRDGRVFAACGTGAVELLQIQLPGKSIITGADFVSGYNPIGRFG